MWRALVALFSVLALSLSSSANVKVQTLKTPGGIDLWLVEQRGLPIVNIEAAFRGGRTMEPAGKAGLARLTAYLMDEGAGDLDAQAFVAALADKAISFSVSADIERMSLSLSFLVEHAAAATKLGALALSQPRFDLAPIKRMKDAILVEQAQVEDDPASKADLVWWQSAFAGSPYGVSGGGDPKSIASITRSDLQDFHKRAFARARLLVVVVGDVDAPAASTMVDALFGPLPLGQPYDPAQTIALTKRGVQVAQRDVPQTVVVFGMPGVKRNDPDFRALHTLNYILGGGSFGSRMMQEIRVKRGLVYGVSTSLTTLDRTGILYGSLATKNETAGEALSVVRAEIAKLRDEGPTVEELADAKSYLIGAWPLAFDSNASVASQLLSFRISGLPAGYSDTRQAEIEALTPERLREVARKYLDPQNMFVVALGKPKGVEPK